MAATAMEDFVSEDVEFIREAIQTEVDELAKELQDEYGLSKDQATDAAKNGLLKGNIASTNGNISAKLGQTVRTIKDFVQQRKNKIPHFLMILAAIEPKGSRRRENELVQRRCEAENLMKLYKLDSATYMECKEVNSYAEMIQEVESYVKDRNVSQLPFIVFWGHGTEAGELAFLEGPRKRCDDALVKIKDCFVQNQAKYMPVWQLRVVFSQCFANLIDNADLPGKIQERGIEYVYVTSSGKPKSRSHLTPHHISSLQKMADARDVHLDHPKLDASMLVVQEAAAELMQLPVFQGCGRKDIEKWLSTEPEDWNQLTQPQRKELEKRQTACKKKMARYLQLSYSESGSTAQPFAVFDQFLERPFEVDSMQIESHADADYIPAMIREFLAGPADDVIMPVVLITGKGRVDETNKLILQCSGGDVEADEIFYQFRHSHEDAMRMVFCCYLDDRASDVVWFSNTKQPTVRDFKNVEMEQYCMAIIGNGPKNKNIQRP